MPVFDVPVPRSTLPYLTLVPSSIGAAHQGQAKDWHPGRSDRAGGLSLLRMVCGWKVGRSSTVATVISASSRDIRNERNTEMPRYQTTDG